MSTQSPPSTVRAKTGVALQYSLVMGASLFLTNLALMALNSRLHTKLDPTVSGALTVALTGALIYLLNLAGISVLGGGAKAQAEAQLPALIAQIVPQVLAAIPHLDYETLLTDYHTLLAALTHDGQLHADNVTIHVPPLSASIAPALEPATAGNGAAQTDTAPSRENMSAPVEQIAAATTAPTAGLAPEGAPLTVPPASPVTAPPPAPAPVATPTPTPPPPTPAS